MRNSKMLIGAALAASSLLGTSALAAPCATGSVASYVLLGATGCSVGGVTFSNIAVNTTVSGGGTITLGNFTPFSAIVDGALESGLSLNYDANAGVAGSSADVSWTYNAAANFLTDAFLSFAGNTTGTGQVQISEILSNGTVLSLNGPGATSATFTPISSVFAIKDQADHANTGTASSSIMTNAYSTTAVPEPASMALFGTALVGLGFLRRRRRKV